MAGETTITIIGNLTGDPELRFTPNGAPVASFTVASTPRTFDRQANEWKDGETLFMRCSVWRDVAENVAETLRKGMRVVVTGRLAPNSWEKEGQKHTSIDLQVDEVGPSLRYATAQVTRVDRRQQGGQRPPAQQGYAAPAAQQAPPQPPQQQYAQGGYQQPQQQPPAPGWPGGPTNTDEPPF